MFEIENFSIFKSVTKRAQDHAYKITVFTALHWVDLKEHIKIAMQRDLAKVPEGLSQEPWTSQV